MSKSKTDIAYEIIKESNSELSFNFLWEKVCEKLNFSKDRADELISPFYTDLSLDGRFITLGENTWDLRERHSFDKVHIDMNDIYSSDEEVLEVDEGIVAKEDMDEELFEEDEKKEE